MRLNIFPWSSDSVELLLTHLLNHSFPAPLFFSLSSFFFIFSTMTSLFFYIPRLSHCYNPHFHIACPSTFNSASHVSSPPSRIFPIHPSITELCHFLMLLLSVLPTIIMAEIPPPPAALPITTATASSPLPVLRPPYTNVCGPVRL